MDKPRKRRSRIRPLNPKPRPKKVLVEGETSEICCKVCERTKTRFLKGRYKKDKLWVDSEGRAFNGRVCAQCHSKQIYKTRLIKKEAAKIK